MAATAAIAARHKCRPQPRNEIGSCLVAASKTDKLYDLRPDARIHVSDGIEFGMPQQGSVEFEVLFAELEGSAAVFKPTDALSVEPHLKLLPKSATYGDEPWVGGGQQHRGPMAEAPECVQKMSAVARRYINEHHPAMDFDGMARTCIVEYYKDGGTHLPFHKEVEPEECVGNPKVFLTLCKSDAPEGASNRNFVVRSNGRSGTKLTIPLGNTDILCMSGKGMHRKHCHGVPKSTKKCHASTRWISITYRTWPDKHGTESRKRNQKHSNPSSPTRSIKRRRRNAVVERPPDGNQRVVSLPGG